MGHNLNKIAVGVGLLATSGAAMAAAQPNILAIFGDDVGYWNISAYNQGMMQGKSVNA
jgi:arylsulfatase